MREILCFIHIVCFFAKAMHPDEHAQGMKKNGGPGFRYGQPAVSGEKEAHGRVHQERARKS
jgi:hypothetical protein